LILHLEANRAKIAAWSASTPAISHSSPEGSYLAWLDCREAGIVSQAMIVASPTLGASDWPDLVRSKLYDPTFTHRFRKAIA